jgi:hypothetical protein
MAEDPTDVQGHLRAASDAILLLVGEIDQLERHKRGVEPASSRFRELAQAVRGAARDLAALAAEESSYAQVAATTDGALPTIVESTKPARLSEILVRWRDVERKLNNAPPGSDESARLFEEFTRIRNEYLAAFEARNRRDSEHR